MAARPPAVNPVDFKPLGLTPIAFMVATFVLLAVVLLGGVVLRMARERSAVSNIGGEVVGVVGRPGSGKTYWCVRLAYSRLKAGANVATNFTMTLPPELAARWQPFTGWEDLMDLHDCVVIIDEAHLMAPSHKSWSLPDEARWKLSQCRRFGLDVYWVSQHESRVNIALRQLTNYVWMCNSFRHGKSFRARCYEPEKLGKEGKHLEIRRYKFDPEIGKLFDSWQILTGSTVMGADENQAKMRQLATEHNARRAGRGGGS